MTPEQATVFAQDWVAAWNRHDIEAVLAHYTDDFEMTTPMIRAMAGIDSDTLCGKRAVGDYWRAALKKVPDLHFTILEVACGAETVSIYYQAVRNKRAIETFFFNQAGMVYKAAAAYIG